MRTRHWLVAALAIALLPGPAPMAAAAPQDAIGKLILSLEEALQSGELDRFRTLVAPEQAGAFARFETLLRGARTRAVVRERDRLPREDGTLDILLDTFIERGSLGQIATWRASVRSTGNTWAFASLTDLSSIDGLHRLSLGEKAYDARDLKITSTDFTLHMRSGIVYAAEVAGGGITALVLRGHGDMIFTPADPAERRQVEIFSGGPELRASFEEAFVRLHPSDLKTRLSGGQLVERAVQADDRRRGMAVFDAFANKTFTLDLQDLSRERWSLVPAFGDLVAEVRTKGHGALTYARSGGEAEDVSLFHRSTRRNIAIYSSAAQREARGRFYSEDDLTDYDIEHLDVDVRVTPVREWIDGTARMRARVRRDQLSTFTLRLAESLVVRSVIARGHGRLMHLRVIGQNNVIITLPTPAQRDEVIDLEVRYGGRLPAQAIDQEVIAVSADQQERDQIAIPAEPRWIYSNHTYWYPQSVVSDFATATLRVTVPLPLDVIGTGVQSGPPAPISGGPSSPASRAFAFESAKPARYLSFVVSRFMPIVSRSIAGDVPATLNIASSPRQASRGRIVADQAAQIFTYYRSLLGTAPYPELTVAVSESDLPGGHSPAYFVLLNQTMPGAPITWRADPVSFEHYPSFFLAHEIAHQWWGQSVGWKNYHEQWISEGFAQYFAALFAGEQRGPDTFAGLMRQMRRWALDKSNEGPISLGYRLGHIQGDSRVFRALVYNKSAVVLHMLRKLVGDERFFAGLRRFYESARFSKAGTDDFRRVMEAETGQNLERFFERWIYGFGIPSVKITHRVETHPDGRSEVVIRAEQGAALYDLPITFRIEQERGAGREAVMLLTDASAELRVPLDAGGGKLRRVVIDSDAAALARFVR